MADKNVFKQLEEQKRIISFLQDKYKNDTGCEIVLPQTWTTFLGTTDQNAPIQGYEEVNDQQYKDKEYSVAQKKDDENFIYALASLNLPQKKVEGKKGPGGMASPQSGMTAARGSKKNVATTFNPANPFHMVETINLSNFNGKKFTRAGFKELIESITDMRCLHCIVLQNNGIDDTYVEDIELLLSNPRITAVDLSRNNIGRIGANQIGKMLKERVHHLEWLDLSRNEFGHEGVALQSICNGIRQQKNLHHFALDVLPSDAPSATDISEYPCRILQVHHGLRSMALVNSKISHSAMQLVCNVLQSPSCYITALSFKFSFLDTKNVFMISKALEVNRTLVKLDLSKNALSPICGVYLMKALRENIILNDINFSGNFLNDEFAFEFARTLKFNDLLWRVDISENPIGKEGGKALLKAIEEDNDSLESLGDHLEKNSASMGVLTIERLRKVLMHNKASKELRSKLLQESNKTIVTLFNASKGKNLRGDDPKNTAIKGLTVDGEQKLLDDEAEDYRLVRPVMFTNTLFKEGYKTRLWNA